MIHTCHAPGCDRKVPPRMFACREHWAALPREYQVAIWREYRPGQERDKDPSARYMAVQTLARALLAFKPYDEAAAKLTAELTLDANVWRTRAVREGAGDPFAGLGNPKLVELPLLDHKELAAVLRKLAKNPP